VTQPPADGPIGLSITAESWGRGVVIWLDITAEPGTMVTLRGDIAGRALIRRVLGPGTRRPWSANGKVGEKVTVTASTADGRTARATATVTAAD
jgi:hypothetical protein